MTSLSLVRLLLRGPTSYIDIELTIGTDRRTVRRQLAEIRKVFNVVMTKRGPRKYWRIDLDG